MKVIIKLKPKTVKVITNYSKENHQEIDDSVEEAITDFLDPGYEQDFDELVEQAIQLTRLKKEIDAHILQRRLKIGFARAQRILKQLRDN